LKKDVINKEIQTLCNLKVRKLIQFLNKTNFKKF
jgi:hypothetical protein